jgi:predicted transcriptional regulator
MPTLKESLQRTRQAVENKMAKKIINHPTLSYKEIGKLFGVSDAYIARIAKSRKIQRPSGTGSPAWKWKQI